MPSQTVARGQDITVTSGQPNTNFPGRAFQRVADSRRTLLSMPLSQIRNRTIVSAVLQPRVRVQSGQPWDAQTISVQPISEQWSINSVTWSNQPSVRLGPSNVITQATPALADGDRFSIDITSFVQQIANGLPNYGWRLTTSSGKSGTFYGFVNSDAWVLTVETSDAPQTPTSLAPTGGVIDRSKFVIRTDFTDDAGATDQASIQVQIDPDQTAPFAFDSGEVATTVPELDLSTTAYAGLANNATTSWRVRVKDSDGYWSPWSAWATVTRVAKPTLTLNSPAGSVLGDPTPVVQATISAGSIKYWLVEVYRDDDPSDVRWSSGRQPGSGTSFITTLPGRTAGGTRIFTDDMGYRLRVRVWDRLDRVTGGSDDRPYLEANATFTFDDDAALAAPSDLTLTPSEESPAMILTWVRSGSADGWVVHRNSELVARLDPDDVTALGAGTYQWSAPDAVPNRSALWQVRALVNGKRGLPVNRTGKTVVKGLWLLSDHGNVNLAGTDLSDLRRKDKRATYDLPGRPDDVDVIGSLGGVAGTFAGELGRSHVLTTTVAVEEKVRIMRLIRRDATTPVQMVYGTRSIPVLLRDVNIDISSEYLPGQNDLYDVSFGCWQVGEFESR